MKFESSFLFKHFQMSETISIPYFLEETLSQLFIEQDSQIVHQISLILGLDPKVVKQKVLGKGYTKVEIVSKSPFEGCLCYGWELSSSNCWYRCNKLRDIYGRQCSKHLQGSPSPSNSLTILKSA